MKRDPRLTQTNVAIFNRDWNIVRQMLSEHHDIWNHDDAGGAHWLHEAVSVGSVDLVEFVLGRGADINWAAEPGRTTALSKAIFVRNVDMVQLLLERGADPNNDRSLLSAINCDDPAIALAIVKLLVEYGADVSKAFEWFNRKDVTFTPLEWAESNDKHEIAAYLRSVGAVDRVKPGAASAGRAPAATGDAAADRSADIVAHFAKQYGPVEPMSQNEVVATGMPIAIHVIPPTKKRKHMVLFTTGMSAQAMRTPAGAEQYRHAELFIHLPGDWPIRGDALRTMNNAWPFVWLRRVARWPHENKSWIGYPVTIISTGDPPKPLAANAPFTSLMLMHRDDFTCRDGTVVNTCIMFPLYKEEHALEVNEDLPTLMKALDRAGIGDVVDVGRKNVGLDGRR